MSELTERRAWPATLSGWSPAVALVLALLVLVGLASGGLAPPERMGPLVPHDVRPAGAVSEALAGPASEAAARRPVVAAPARAASGAVEPAFAAPARPARFADQDADGRRSRLRLRIEIRGPPGARSA